ncbi:hypothetical protein LXN10_01410 [Arcobacter sp. KX21116]|uniref:hypothetical protein n=1 Tax=Arcobacter iocasae TaxID=2906515 RepID=UPI0035D45B31
MKVASVIIIIFFILNQWIFIIMAEPFLSIKHFVFTPAEELYKPIIYDDFNFYKKGYSKTFKLNYNFIDRYEIDLLDETHKIPTGRYNKSEKYKLNGKIQFDFYSNDKLIKTEITQSTGGGAYASDMKYFEFIVLMMFNIPMEYKYYKNMTLKVTVLEPIADLENKNLKLSVRVTSIR